MPHIPSDERQPDDPLRPVQRFCERVTYCSTLGMYAGDMDGNRICLVMPFSNDILGDTGRQLVSTGALSALIDSACGIAVLHRIGHSEPIATLDLRVDYLRPVAAGTEIICWADCHRLSRNVAFTRAEVFAAGQSEASAVSAGSFMRLKRGSAQ